MHNPRRTSMPHKTIVRAIAASLMVASSALADGGTAVLATSIDPPLSSLHSACQKGEQDSRNGIDNSSMNARVIRAGTQPITWFGATSGIYRYCRGLAMRLEALPTGPDLRNATTQQLVLGGVTSNPQGTTAWNVAFAMGKQRIKPTVIDMAAWKQLQDGSGRWVGFNTYHFNASQIVNLLKEGKRTRTPTYLLVVQNGRVNRWLIK